MATGTVWEHDGSVAYVATTTPGSDAGAIGSYVPPNQLTYTPIDGFTPQQIALSPAGTRLFVPGRSAVDAGGGVRVLDARTLATVTTIPVARNTWQGIPAIASDGVLLYVAAGPDVTLGVVLQINTVVPALPSAQAFDSPALGVYVSAKAAAARTRSGANQKMYVGRVFDHPAVATVVDAAGNPAPYQLVSWTVTPAGPATLQGCAICYARADIGGTVSSPFIVAGPNPGSFSVVATPVEATAGATAAQFPMTIRLRALRPPDRAHRRLVARPLSPPGRSRPPVCRWASSWAAPPCSSCWAVRCSCCPGAATRPAAEAPADSAQSDRIRHESPNSCQAYPRSTAAS